METWVKPRNTNGQTLFHLASASISSASQTSNPAADFMLQLSDNKLCVGYEPFYEVLAAGTLPTDEQAFQYLADYQDLKNVFGGNISQAKIIITPMEGLKIV